MRTVRTFVRFPRNMSLPIAPSLSEPRPVVGVLDRGSLTLPVSALLGSLDEVPTVLSVPPTADGVVNFGREAPGCLIAVVDDRSQVEDLLAVAEDPRLCCTLLLLCNELDLYDVAPLLASRLLRIVRWPTTACTS